MSVEVGLRIPMVSGIPDASSCNADSKSQEFNYRFPGLKKASYGSINLYLQHLTSLIQTVKPVS